MIEEIIASNNDRGFFNILNISQVQQKLFQLLGSIPDGQRNACWNALLIILPKDDDSNDNIDNNNSDNQTENIENPMIQHSSRALNCIFSLGNILSAIGLSVQPFRPVPENVMVLLLSEVFFIFEFFSYKLITFLLDCKIISIYSSTILFT